jgi:putative endonuclease
VKHRKQKNKESSELGRLGEKLACRFLLSKKYKILETNYWKPWGEIDIIARAPDKTLVFFEVKTVRSIYPKKLRHFRSISELTPEDQMSGGKIIKLKRIADSFVNSHSDLIKKSGWRIDLISISVSGQDQDIVHYQNVV